MGLEFGLASSLFAVALCFTLVTMYDAAGVRYHSGKSLNILYPCFLDGINNIIYNTLDKHVRFASRSNAAMHMVAYEGLSAHGGHDEGPWRCC